MDFVDMVWSLIYFNLIACTFSLSGELKMHVTSTLLVKQCGRRGLN